MSSEEKERSRTRYVYKSVFGTAKAQDPISSGAPSKETLAHINDMLGVRKNKNSEPDNLLS